MKPNVSGVFDTNGQPTTEYHSDSVNQNVCKVPKTCLFSRWPKNATKNRKKKLNKVGKVSV